jgi:hypothetical protein
VSHDARCRCPRVDTSLVQCPQLSLVVNRIANVNVGQQNRIECSRQNYARKRQRGAWLRGKKTCIAPVTRSYVRVVDVDAAEDQSQCMLVRSSTNSGGSSAGRGMMATTARLRILKVCRRGIGSSPGEVK